MYIAFLLLLILTISVNAKTTKKPHKSGHKSTPHHQGKTTKHPGKTTGHHAKTTAKPKKKTSKSEPSSAKTTPSSSQVSTKPTTPANTQSSASSKASSQPPAQPSIPVPPVQPPILPPPVNATLTAVDYCNMKKGRLVQVCCTFLCYEGIMTLGFIEFMGNGSPCQVFGIPGKCFNGLCLWIP